MRKTQVIRVRVEPELEKKIEAVKAKEMRENDSDVIRFLIRLGFQSWEQAQKG